MSAAPLAQPSRGPALEQLVACVQLRPDGEPCGRTGMRGLPAGVCDQHAMSIYRAVVALAARSDDIREQP